MNYCRLDDDDAKVCVSQSGNVRHLVDTGVCIILGGQGERIMMKLTKREKREREKSRKRRVEYDFQI